ncbi:MAG: GDP-mannose 4,6-dehydratase [Pseudomonadota bacterium]
MQKHILITGGAGFIGSHLAETLLKQGHHVTVIDNLSTGRFENIKPLVERWGPPGGAALFRFAIDNITNQIVLDRLISECDLIFHLAAAVGVKLIVENPVHTIETNVMGTEAILKTALRYQVKVLITSTSEVYGKGNHIPFGEDDDVVLGPTCRSRWSYAASKMVDEFLALAYFREKGLPVIIVRLFNTVGPRQTGQYGMVVPRFVQQALKGEPLSIYGDGKQSRCFLHVKDAVTALIGLMMSPKAVGGVFNVGSTEEVSIEALARSVLSLVRKKKTNLSEDLTSLLEFIPYEKAYAEGFEDMFQRVPDISKIARLIGWKPIYSLQNILKDVISFHPEI